MDLLGEFLLRLLVSLLYVFVPGLAILGWTRFRSTSRLDALLACVSSGFAWTGFCVYVLLLCNGYTKLTAALILLLPAAAVTRGWRALVSSAVPAAGPALSRADLAVAGIAGAVLLAWFVDAATSPILGWDGSITWDKWAADWGRRQHLYGYMLGGYPQLMPMFASVLYKLTGTALRPLPLEQFVLHSLHPLFAFVVLGAVIRLCQLLRAPAWPALALVFSNAVLQGQLTSGSADLLLTGFAAAALALQVAYLRGACDSRFGIAAVIGPALFGVFFTKANGFWYVLVPLSFYCFGRTLQRDVVPLAPLRGRALASSVLLPVLACVPFYVTQFSGTDLEQLNPREVNLSASAMIPALQRVTAESYHRQSVPERLGTAADRMLEAMPVGPAWSLVLAVPLVVLMVASSRTRVGVTLMAPAVIGMAMWFQLSSYDLRNALFLLPIAGVLLSLGTREAARVAGGALRGRLLIGVTSIAISVIGAAGLVAHITTLRDSMGATALSRRVRAMQAGVDARISLYYPDQWPVYAFVRSLPITPRATNILATTVLYRWFESGAYALSYWPVRQWSRSGDVFVGISHHRPPAGDDWTLLRAGAFNIWVLDRTMQCVPGSSLRDRAVESHVITSAASAQEPDGLSRLVAYDLEHRGLQQGSYVVWRAAVDRRGEAGRVGAGYRVYDANVVDTTRTSLAVETTGTDANTIFVSGLLTFAGPTSSNLADAVLVGAAVDGAFANDVRELCVAVHR